MRRSLITVMSLAILLLGGSFVRAAEMRAFWADAWHAGFKSSSEVTTMVSTAKNNNYNVIVVQVRKRGDCYYFPTSPNTEPRATDIASGYDPLADVITQAHAQGLKVYAWVTTNLIWSDSANPPSSPSHVYNAHPEWLMKTSTGATYIGGEGYYLDPGVPAAQTWNYNVCMDLVQHYNIDGLHLDYIRYPQQDSGYNDIAVARFNAEYNRTGTPSPSDSQFSAWRRKQMTDLVARIYSAAIAAKPGLVVSAATFASRSDAYSYRFQDWAGWMSLHILDANMPMNYTATNSTFNSRVDDAYNYRYSRHLYMGQGAYLNTISNTITQLTYVRNKGCNGMCTYSYQATNNQGYSNSTFYSNIKSQLFPTATTVPTMSWKTSPTLGILKGTVTAASNGAAIYNATITISSKSDLSDGNGCYTITDISPGTYSVSCSATGYNTSTGTVTISAGGVATLNFSLSSGVTDIIIDNVNSGFSCSANWSTGSSATDKYGADYRYRSTQAISDPATWTPNIPVAGNYEVYAWWSQGTNRSASAPYIITYNGGSTTVNVNQQINGGKWNSLGTYNFAAGTSGNIKLSCWTTTGYVVIADAIKLVAR